MKDAFAKTSKKVKNPTKLIDCSSGKMSFYNLVEDITDEQSSQPLHRFCSLMRKMGAVALLREELVLNKELLEEKQQLDQRCRRPVGLKATRLTFFCRMPAGGEWTDPQTLSDEHLLGYAVVVKLRLPNRTSQCYLYEAIAQLPQVFLNNPDGTTTRTPISHYYMHNIRVFETSIGPAGNFRNLKLTGSYFAQQNGLTSVCAHACLRMAVNSSPTLSTKKLTNKQINDLLGMDFSTPEKTIGHYKPVDKKDVVAGGLTREEIELVVQKLGGRIVSADFNEKPTVEYDYFIYPLVESGCPVMLALEGWNAKNGKFVSHVVAVVGHTLNSDRWAPEARFGYGNFPVTAYSSTTEWVDHFVICDDNYGMYLTLPSDMVRNFILPTKTPTLHAVRAVGIVPQGVAISGYAAERVASLVAKDFIKGVKGISNQWLKRLSKNSLVCRTLLQRSDEYRRNLVDMLRTIGGSLSSGQDACLQALPEYVWVSEVSLAPLYATNKCKLGDVVIRADATEAEHREWLSFAFGWFPGFCMVGLNTVEMWPVSWHVPLIRRSGSPTIEW